MPKKLFGIISVFVLAVGLLVSLNLASKKQDIRKRASGSGSILTVEPATSDVNTGETFQILINVNTMDDTISGAELHLTYDSANLSGVSIVPGDFLPTQIVTGRNTNGNVDIILGAKMEYDSAGNTIPVPRKGIGTLVTLTFTALKASTTQLNFAPSTQVVAIGKNGNTLAQSTGGTITVGVSLTPTITPNPSVTATPVPSATPTLPPYPTITSSPAPTLTITPILTNTPTATPTGSPPGNCIRKVHGDANCDRTIDGIDYSFWLNSQCHASSGQICANKDADFNHDGNIDDEDYSIWFQYRNN